MGDYTDNKPKISGAYPLDVNKLEGGDGAGGFSRVESWLTPERLKSEWVTTAQLTDPRTKLVMTDETIKNFIRRAAAEVELKCKVDVFPTQRLVKRDFDRTKYIQGWNELDLGHKNITSIQEVSIRAVNSVSTDNPQPTDSEGSILYRVPLEWLDTSFFAKGLLHFVPLQTSFTGTGLAGGAISGSAAPLFAVFSRLNWIPSFWHIRFTTGFEENSIPSVINTLIGNIATIKILSRQAANNKNNSQSIGVDGVSQSVSGPGPQLYAQRIQDLKEENDDLIDLIRARFSTKIFMTNF